MNDSGFAEPDDNRPEDVAERNAATGKDRQGRRRRARTDDSDYEITRELIRAGGMGGGIGGVLYSDKSMAPSAGPVEYFNYNGVGSTVALTDASAMVTQTNLYEAFGEVVLSTGASDNNRLRNTKERDVSLGFDNDGFRYYDTASGRYIQRDLIGYRDGLNVYAHVTNNPVNHVDPLGLSGENTPAAEGRVAHKAIQEDLAAREGAASESKVVRSTTKNGKSDVLSGDRHAEIKPASKDGIPDGKTQMATIDQRLRGEHIVYRQTGQPQKAGGSVDYVRLSQSQHDQLVDAVKNGLTNSDDIFKEASRLAEGNIQKTTVSAEAASRAGRLYIDGKEIITGDTAPKGQRRIRSRHRHSLVTRLARQFKEAMLLELL